MTDTVFRLRPISATDADALRAGDHPVMVADEHPGYPCRQCLRDAEAGDELILVSHDPFVADSPYRSASPIFLHRTSCAADVNAAMLPDQLTRRELSVRSFDASAMMIDAAVIDGTSLQTTIATFFENEASDHLHVHNATRGCWAVTIERS